MKLSDISTRAPENISKKELRAENKKLTEKISEFQRIMYAQEKHSMLLVLQGVDASGKDGAIRELFKQVNPSGCRVNSFRKPTEKEFAHDFLWRVHQHAPQKGMIQVFNRSHYEDILVPSVGKYMDPKTIEERYELINNFERLLEHNGTTILKFYLHVSREEQLERLHERINNPQKHWKHKDGDWETREQWDALIEVYESILVRCNKPEWKIIPSDQNWYKIHEISNHVIDAFKAMNLAWPALESDRFNSSKKTS